MTSATSTQWLRRTLYVAAIALLLALFVLLGILVASLRSDVGAGGFAPVAGLRALSVIVGPGVGDEPLFDSPMAAAFGEDGRIYVADTGNSRIVVFDRRGDYLFQFGGFGVGKPMPGGTFSWEPGLLNYPTDVAIDANGDLYVADFRNDQIEVFDADGDFLRVFPDRMHSVGKGASGQDGTGIAVTSLALADGRVYATDTYQVMVFETDGRLVAQFGRPGRGANGLDHPNGIAVSSDSLVVSDSNNNRVVGLTTGGRRLWTLGAHSASDLPTDGLVAQEDSRTAPFEVPRGLAPWRAGDLIIADAMASRLVRVSSAGRLVGFYGQFGSAPGELSFPTDVDAAEGRLLITEKGGNRVQVMVIDEQ